MPSDDGAARVPLGPVGRYVIDNLAELRAARRLTYKQLADRLEQLGRPIPTLGLSRIEKGARRVDADDLVALAIALQVNPAALLLPKTARPDDEIELTTRVSAPAAAAWRWADGRIPLPRLSEVTQPEQADFEKYARPPWDVTAYGPQAPIFRPVTDERIADMMRRIEDLEQRLQVERARNGHTEEEPVQPAVITAIVTSDLGVLVGHRNDGKPPWTFIAGEQEPGERIEDTAIREVKEETGLRVQVGDVIGQRVHPKTQRTMIYVAARPTHGTGVIVGDEEELAEVKWASLAEADELMKTYGMFDAVHEYLERTIGGEGQ
jgi:8-oxo-dGTP pyrophosphatase MutT (NUDIX family)/transcriptional regulator with XRE-family HTH domain